MPIDFPSNPTDGQIFGNYYWSSSVGAWNSLGSPDVPNILRNGTFTSTSSTTVPLSVTGAGSQSANLQEWKNSSGSTLASISSIGGLSLGTQLTVQNGGTGATSFTSGSYLKGNGSSAIVQQIGIPATDINSGSLNVAYGGTGAITGAGLVPIIPTSVAVGSGSASVSSTGLVTFTNVSSVSLNQCFSSNFRNYRVIIRVNSSTLADLRMRERSGTTDATDATHYFGGWRVDNSAATNTYSGTTDTSTKIALLNSPGSGVCSVSMDLQAVNSAEWTTGIITAWSAFNTMSVGFSHANSTAYDGATFFPNTGNITGTIQVYGYRN